MGFSSDAPLLFYSDILGDWVNDGVFTKSREITISGLTPGALYAMSLRVKGGSTGASDWSNVVTGRCL